MSTVLNNLNRTKLLPDVKLEHLWNPERLYSLRGEMWKYRLLYFYLMICVIMSLSVYMHIKCAILVFSVSLLPVLSVCKSSCIPCSCKDFNHNDSQTLLETRMKLDYYCWTLEQFTDEAIDEGLLAYCRCSENAILLHGVKSSEKLKLKVLLVRLLTS